MVNSNNLAPNDEQIIANSADYFQALLYDIAKAKKSIDLETYIFTFDPLGEKVISALANAARRGVRVRVLVDGAGSPNWGGKLIRLLEKSGASSRIFHPFPWRLWQWSHSVVKLPWIIKPLYLILKINSRNHRKVCVIDEKIAYIGSHNISQCHLSREEKGQNWRDISVRLSNTDLTDLSKAFKAAWHHLPVQERIRQFFKHIRANPTFRLNNTRHRRRILYKKLLRRISRCRERIWITNAYFVPDHMLLKNIKDAAERGVDVRILLPRHSDVMMMPLASSAFYRSLLQAGVRIFEYMPSMLHAKTLILDNWMTVGSSNLNHRSLLHDLEVDVKLRLSSSRKQLENLFLEDISKASEIKLDNWKQRPRYQRLLARLLLYVKYII